MKNFKKHEEGLILQSLRRKKDILISDAIYVLSNDSPFKAHDLGNKSWGKIDYLVNYCGYFINFVKKFPKYDQFK